MEALVGPIQDELVSAGDPDAAPVAVKAADGSRLVDGLTRLSDWREMTGEALEAADHLEVETVGGLVMARLGRIPVEGDEVQVGRVRLRVEALDGMRVALVRVLPPARRPHGDVPQDGPGGGGEEAA